MHFDAHQSGFVALEDGNWKLLGVVATIDNWVGFVLDGFEQLLAGRTPVVNIGGPVKM